jgi:hypothetical protein
LNRLLLVIPQNVTDIGCGLKLFKKDLIKRLLPNLKINGFAIDSEILNEIGKIGYQVSVIPFFLNINRSSSTSANISQTTAILRDIFNIAIHNRVEANTTAQILEYNN